MQATQVLTNGRFTQTQLELLKFFSTEPTEEELKDIRAFFINYLAEKALDAVEESIKEKGYSKETVNSWSKEHNRVSYKSYRQFLAKQKQNKV